MAKPRGLWVWIFLFCWLFTLAAGTAWAKSRSKRARVARPGENGEKKYSKKRAARTKKGKKADAEEPAAAAEPAPKPPGIEDPQTLLTLARSQEAGGDITGCMQTLAKFVNVHSRIPERAAILEKMAQLALAQGQEDKALQIYALTSYLDPRSQAAAAAKWRISTLEFARNLRERDPVASFKDFLQIVKSQHQGLPPERLREPVLQGWEAVARVLRRTSPCPVHLVEEALALWELQPPGTQPPEGALILGELLQEKGLYEEARSYLLQAREQGTPEVGTRALVALLEGAWVSRDLEDFVAAWTLWRRHGGEITPDLKSRLDKLPLSEALLVKAPGPGQEEKSEADMVSALLDWWNGKAPAVSGQAELFGHLDHFLSRPLPPAVKERLLLQLAQRQWSQGHHPQAAKIYQELLTADGKGKNSAFYQDRLALSQLLEQRPEEARQIYHDLSREGDNFWQLVSRTRLADMELGRLQTEPPQ